MVNTLVDSNFIFIFWTVENRPLLHQQVQIVQVTVTSKCLTGAGVARTQFFNVIPSEGNSINITGLGELPANHGNYYCNAILCQELSSLIVLFPNSHSAKHTALLVLYMQCKFLMIMQCRGQDNGEKNNTPAATEECCRTNI